VDIVSTLLDLIWRSVKGRPLGYVVAFASVVAGSLAIAAHFWTVPTGWYWAAFAVGCIVPPAAWWGRWALSHAGAFAGYIKQLSGTHEGSPTGNSEPSRAHEGSPTGNTDQDHPRAKPPRPPAVPRDWLAFSVLWIVAVALAASNAPIPKEHQAAVEQPSGAQGPEIRSEVSPAATTASPAPWPTPTPTAAPTPTPVPSRSASSMLLVESHCGENETSTVEIDLTLPPDLAMHYWIFRTSEEYRNLIYPHGPPVAVSTKNPYLEFAVPVPICDRLYFLALEECNDAAHATVDALARSSTTNYLTSAPDGCIALGSFKLRGGQPAAALEPTSPP
jgi:hypothetical protein